MPKSNVPSFTFLFTVLPLCFFSPQFICFLLTVQHTELKRKTLRQADIFCKETFMCALWNSLIIRQKALQFPVQQIRFDIKEYKKRKKKKSQFQSSFLSNLAGKKRERKKKKKNKLLVRVFSSQFLPYLSLALPPLSSPPATTELTNTGEICHLFLVL